MLFHQCLAWEPFWFSFACIASAIGLVTTSRRRRRRSRSTIERRMNLYDPTPPLTYFNRRVLHDVPTPPIRSHPVPPPSVISPTENPHLSVHLLPLYQTGVDIEPAIEFLQIIAHLMPWLIPIANPLCSFGKTSSQISQPSQISHMTTSSQISQPPQISQPCR